MTGAQTRSKIKLQDLRVAKVSTRTVETLKKKKRERCIVLDRIGNEMNVGR